MVSEVLTPQDRYTAEEAEFYQLTGEVIREWIELELFLSQWLIYLLGVDEFRSRIVWDSFTSFRARANMLGKLIKNFADETVWGEGEAILKRVEKIADNRNTLAHTFGHLGERVGNLVFVKDTIDRGEVNFTGARTVNRANLKAWIADINKTRGDVATFKRERLAGGVHRESLFHRRRLGEVPSEPTGDGK